MLTQLETFAALPELLIARTAATPTGTAFLRGGPPKESGPTTWRSFAADVAASASALQRCGIGNGDRVVIQLPPCYEWEVIQQSAWMLGAAVIGVDPRSSASKIESILTQLTPQLWVTRGDCRIGTDPPWRFVSCPVVDVSSESSLSDAGPCVNSWDKLLGESATNPLTNISPVQRETPAVIVFTSGTTGFPRGIEYNHQQLLIACRALKSVYAELGSVDRTLSWLPMSGLFQRMVNLAAVAIGMETCFVERPSDIENALREYRPTILAGVPRFFEKLADLVDLSPEPWIAEWATSVRYLVSGSAPLLPSVQNRLHRKGILVLEAYGLSENCVPLCANRQKEFRFGTVGKPLPENELRIEPDGEIQVRGPGLFQGYFRMGRPADRFTDDGFYRTGDYGHFDDKGFLRLMGRKSSLIKTSTGRRIASMMVEAVYAHSPLVEQIVVFGERRKRLAALVVVNGANLRRALPEFPDQVSDASEVQLREALILLLQDLEKREPELADYEQVDVFGILEKPLSVECGELTENFKLRRDVVLTHNECFLQVLEKLEKRCAVAAWDPGTVVEGERRAK